MRKTVLCLLLVSVAIFVSACDSGKLTGSDSDNTPVITVSEVTTASGGKQARFSWTHASVWRLSVTRPNPNGTSTIMWSWEIDEIYAVSNGITYGATPTGAKCNLHQCQATGLTRQVPYTVKIWYSTPASDQSVSLDFTL